VADVRFSSIDDFVSASDADPVADKHNLLNTVREADQTLHSFLEFNSDPPSATLAGPLRGVPIGVKDNIATVGTRTTCGSKVLREYRSPFDATAVERLKNAGAWIAGKTNLDEFAMGSSTEHSAFGVTRNPWDLDRVAGGSSGGSAAAVAAGLVPAALGSETGGSVRQPAAFCGVVGVKPTYGRVSRYGLVAFASSLDQIGVVARTVADAALVLETIAGADHRDSTCSEVLISGYSDLRTSTVERRRFGIISEAVESLDSEARHNFEEAVAVYRRLGAIVEQVSVPEVREAIAIYYVVANAEASSNLARFDGVRYGFRHEGASSLDELYERSRGEGFGAEVKRRIMLGTFTLSSGFYDAYYGRAQRALARLSAAMTRAMDRFEFLITPTTLTPAFRIGEKTRDPLAMYLSDVFTAPANLSGIPAIAVPSGFSSKGLPLSLQIMARHFEEKAMFEAAHCFERETRYYRERPGSRVA